MVHLQQVPCEFEMSLTYESAVGHRIVSKCDELLQKKSPKSSEKQEDQSHLLLRGQLFYVDDWKAIIFLCNPLCVTIQPLFSNDGITLYFSYLSLKV